MPAWVFILHFYQPPTQSANLTETILRSCYLPILDILLDNPRAEMTLNISGSLILNLETIRDHDFFPKIQALTARGQVEILSSPIFHPIIPLTPPSVVLRQLKENSAVIEKFCGARPVAGIFPPELALDPASVKLLQNEAEFLIADESSVNPEFNPNNLFENCKLKIENLSLLVSSRAVTEIIRSYPTELHAANLAQHILNILSTNRGESEPGIPVTLVSVSDAEVFGHHYSERIHFLRDLLASPDFRFIKASEAVATLTPAPLKTLTASSWQTSRSDLEAGIPFPLWKHPENRLQKQYWQLATYASSALEQFVSMPEDSSVPYHLRHSAENHLDHGLSSCHPYWLSHRPWWHPDLVELGARELVKCVRTLPGNTQKIQAETLYHRFVRDMWLYHWSGEVEKSYGDFEARRREFISTLPAI